MKHQLRWFINRINKRVWRSDLDWSKKESGIVIKDKTHAQYLHMVQYDLDVNYRDQK